MNLGQRQALSDLAATKRDLLDQVDVIDRVLAVFGADDVVDLRDPGREERPGAPSGEVGAPGR